MGLASLILLLGASWTAAQSDGFDLVDTLTLQGNITSITVANVNSDREPDLICATQSASQSVVIYNNGGNYLRRGGVLFMKKCHLFLEARILGPESSCIVYSNMLRIGQIKFSS